VKSVPLRWLIVVPFVVLTLIAGITLYLVSTITIANVANSVGIQYIKEVEDRIHGHIRHFTAPLSSIVDINRNAFSYRPELLDSLTPLASRLYEQATPYSHMTFISVATTDGRYLSSTRNPFKKEQHSVAANFVNKTLTMEGFEYDPVRHIGDKIAADPSFGYDPRTRPFYQDAVKAQGMVWSKVHPYYGFPTLGIGLSGPIYDQQGKLLGVTATSVALTELDDFLESIALVDNAYIFLAERNGALIATSSKDDLYTITNGVTTRVSLVTHPDKVLQVASKQLESGAYSLEVDGENFLYHVRSISLGYGETWLIGILIPSSHHKIVLAEHNQAAIFITLILFVCIALVGSLIARYIGKPIQRLNQAANDKNLESIQKLPQPLSGISEINSLSQGLHLMADNLADIMQNLDKKVAQRTSHLEDENENLLECAVTDELTKLNNRRGLNQAFERTFKYAQVQKKSITFVLCDIDHFKSVNDKFGHSAGDLALVEVAKILKSHLRSTQEIVARYGGEEFALVFVDTDLNHVIERMNKIRQEFVATPVFDNQHITMSFGITYIEDTSSITQQMLIDATDAKLYRAKNSGRDKIVS